MGSPPTGTAADTQGEHALAGVRRTASSSAPGAGQPPPRSPLSAQDIQRFREGEPDAVRAVYREYGRLVYAVTRNMLGSPQLAEDATQQTFIKAWRSASLVEPGRDLAPWLATIARRTAIDVHRREARQVTSPLDDVPAAHPSVVQAPVQIEQSYDVWQVRRAIDELPADERVVVRMQHLEGHTQSEVATALGVPLGTVKSRAFRAHRKLAVRLA